MPGRWRRALLPAATALCIIAAPASAGGWWSEIDLEARYLGVGETLTSVSEVLFPTNELAEQARRSGDFRAYLVRGIDQHALERAMSVEVPGRWWSPPDEMILVGHVTVSQRRSNLTSATAKITIPKIPPGPYYLMLCDKGCRTPLADIIPKRVQVASDTVSARTARKVETIGIRIRRSLRAQQQRRLAGMREAVRDARHTSTDALAEVRRLQNALAERPSRHQWIPYLGWFLGGVVGAIAALLIRRRRRRRSRKGVAPGLTLSTWTYSSAPNASSSSGSRRN